MIPLAKLYRVQIQWADGDLSPVLDLTEDALLYYAEQGVQIVDRTTSPKPIPSPEPGQYKPPPKPEPIPYEPPLGDPAPELPSDENIPDILPSDVYQLSITSAVYTLTSLGKSLSVQVQVNRKKAIDIMSADFYLNILDQADRNIKVVTKINHQIAGGLKFPVVFNVDDVGPGATVTLHISILMWKNGVPIANKATATVKISDTTQPPTPRPSGGNQIMGLIAAATAATFLSNGTLFKKRRR